MRLDITRLGPKLYIGSMPPTGTALADAGFNALVLCAEEWQPRSREFPGLSKVIHAPIDDSVTPSESELRIVSEAAHMVAKEVRAGRRVLVTCMAGRNRSGFVCAAALHLLTGLPGSECALYVRRKRKGLGGRALDNTKFVELLAQLT